MANLNAYDVKQSGLGSECIKSTILYWAELYDEAMDYVTIFHYGDWIYSFETADYYWTPDGYNWHHWTEQVEHYNYYDHYGELVGDIEIYPQTDQGHHYFVFLWTCVNGEICGYYDSDWSGYYMGGYLIKYGTGPVGMPFSWMHQAGLSSNGYASPDSSDYCFISFENLSHWLSDPTGYADYTCGNFTAKFYEEALQDGNTINEALDLAATYTFGSEKTFEDTELYTGYNMTNEQGTFWSKMRVWGNGNNMLPQD